MSDVFFFSSAKDSDYLQTDFNLQQLVGGYSISTIITTNSPGKVGFLIAAWSGNQNFQADLDGFYFVTTEGENVYTLEIPGVVENNRVINAFASADELSNMFLSVNGVITAVTNDVPLNPNVDELFTVGSRSDGEGDKGWHGSIDRILVRAPEAGPVVLTLDPADAPEGVLVDQSTWIDAQGNTWTVHNPGGTISAATPVAQSTLPGSEAVLDGRFARAVSVPRATPPATVAFE